MSDVGERIIAGLNALREELRALSASLGQTQPLGFGKLAQPLYLFLNHEWWKDETKPYLLYTKRTLEDRQPIYECDLTCYIRNLYRRDQVQASGKNHPVLDVELFAGRSYVLQTGFYNNISISLLAALAELEAGAIKEPLTLLFETSQGRRSFATIFCRVISRGQRLNPQFDKKTDVKALYEAVTTRFGFGPWQTGESAAGLEAREGEDHG